MWSGDLYIGNCFALYYGEAGSNDVHHHVTYQLIVCDSGNVDVIDKSGRKLTAKGMLIKPLIDHSISSDFPLTIIYIEPQSDLAFKLLKTVSKKNITAFSQDDLTIDIQKEPEQLIKLLSSLAFRPSRGIDLRILRALKTLSENPGSASIVDIAQECDLSASRLRTITRKQLGVPLATWHLWSKLQVSVNMLLEGASFSEAALSGGFSDQAHFNRTMRRMFGITPSTAIKSLS